MIPCSLKIGTVSYMIVPTSDVLIVLGRSRSKTLVGKVVFVCWSVAIDIKYLCIDNDKIVKYTH
jgi:hypothetical protein